MTLLLLWFICVALVIAVRRLPVGTRSLLFGVHQIFVHPLFMAVAWTKLYGFPLDLRLWVAFFVHDLGYWGKRDMDGEEGERHVELGAKIMHRLFDHDVFVCWDEYDPNRWRNFCLYHSRFYAKKAGRPFSRLCVCDKQVIVSTPWWIYLPFAFASGEVHEYIAKTREGKYTAQVDYTPSAREWHRRMVEYCVRWVAEHKDMKEDTWTKVS